MNKPLPPVAYTIPPLIKRNTTLFSLSQCFTGAGMQLAYGIGPLMVMAVTGEAGLAGITVALMGLSRFLVSYPIGKVTDAFGRKPGILMGLVLALGGTVTVGLSMQLLSFGMLVFGMLVFGMGMNAANQMRVAATDMFPPRLRAQALGYVALGSLAGLVICPVMISGAEMVAPSLGQYPLGLPWFLLPVLILGGMVLVVFVRPDPKEIGQNLREYYPNYVPPPAPAPGSVSPKFGTMTLMRFAPTRLGIVCNAAAQGNMSIVMVLTSLVLSHHGYSLSAIAFSHTFHSLGMFGFTIPLGKLADRFGRERVMYPGVAASIVGALLVSIPADIVSVTIGTYLVGIGWAAANVAATALIADKVETAERGRAIGVAESFAGASSVMSALITGPLIAWLSLPAAGVLAVLLAAVPLLMRAFTSKASLEAVERV